MAQNAQSSGQLPSGETATGSSPAQAAKDVAVATAPQREVEIKFRADQSAVKDLLASAILKNATVSSPKELAAVYFDTAERHLQAQGLALC